MLLGPPTSAQNRFSKGRGARATFCSRASFCQYATHKASEMTIFFHGPDLHISSTFRVPMASRMSYSFPLPRLCLSRSLLRFRCVQSAPVSRPSKTPINRRHSSAEKNPRAGSIQSDEGGRGSSASPVAALKRCPFSAAFLRIHGRACSSNGIPSESVRLPEATRRPSNAAILSSLRCHGRACSSAVRLTAPSMIGWQRRRVRSSGTLPIETAARARYSDGAARAATPFSLGPDQYYRFGARATGGQRDPEAQREQITCDVAHLYPPPQGVGFRSMIPDVGVNALPPVRPGPCRMLHPDFGEFPFHALR
jgi:hypothetical protein